MSTDFTDLGVDLGVPSTTPIDLTPEPTDKASVLKQKREQKINTLASKVPASDNSIDNNTDNLDKRWDAKYLSDLQSTFNTALQYSLQQDGDKYYYVEPDGKEVPYTGPVRRLYSYPTTSGDDIKFGTAADDAVFSDNKFTPITSNNEEYEKRFELEGINTNEPLLLDKAGNPGVLLPKNIAESTEKIIHDNHDAFRYLLSKQPEYTDNTEDPGIETAEYIDNTSNFLKEKPLSISESIRQRVRERYRDNIPYRAANTVQGVLSAAAKGLVIDPIDVVGELINYTTDGKIGWDIGTSEEKRKYVNDFFNYDAGYSNEAASKAKKHIQNVYEALKDPKKSVDLGDVIGAVYEGTTPEMVGETIGHVLAMVFGLGKFTKLGKAEDSIKKAVASGKITKEEGVKQLKELKKAASIANRATYTAAKNAGVLNVAAAQTSEDIDVYKSLNEGVGPDASTVLRMYGVQVALTALDKTVDLSILKGIRLTPKVIKKQATRTAKDAVEASTHSTLPILLKNSAKLVSKLGAAGAKEAAQEYVQALGTAINQQYGTKIAGDDLYELLSNPDNQIEAFTGAALGAGTGMVMRTPSAVVQSFSDRNPDSDRNIQKQIRKLPEETQKVLEEEVDITGKSAIETAKDYRRVVLELEDLVGKKSSITPENLNAAIEALDLLNKNDEVLKGISKDHADKLKWYKDYLSDRVTSFLKEADEKGIKLGSLLSPENPEQGKNKALRLLLHTAYSNPSSLSKEDYGVLRNIAVREGINESIVPDLPKDGYAKTEYEATIADNGYITKEIQLSRMLESGIPNVSKFTKTLNQLKAWHQTTLKGIQQLQDTINQAETNANLLNKGKDAPKKVVSEYVKLKDNNKPFDIIIRQNPETGLYYADTKAANEFINSKLRTANSINGIAHYFNEVINNSFQDEDIKTKVLPILQNTIENHNSFFSSTNPLVSSTEFQPIHKKVENKAIKFLNNYDISEEDRKKLTTKLLNRIKHTTDNTEIQNISDKFKNYINSNYEIDITKLQPVHKKLVDKALNFLQKYHIDDKERKSVIVSLLNRIKSTTDKQKLKDISDEFKLRVNKRYVPVAKTTVQKSINTENLQPVHKRIEAKATAFINNYDIPEKDRKNLISGLLNLIKTTTDKNELQNISDKFKKYVSKAYMPVLKEVDDVEVSDAPVKDLVKTAKKILKDKEISVEHYNAISSELIELYKNNESINKQELETLIEGVVKNNKQLNETKVYIGSPVHKRFIKALKKPVTENGEKGALETIKKLKGIKFPNRVKKALEIDENIKKIQKNYKKLTANDYNSLLKSLYEKVTYLDNERTIAKLKAEALKKDTYRIIGKVLEIDEEVKTEVRPLLEGLDINTLVEASAHRKADYILKEIINKFNSVIRFAKDLQHKRDIQKEIDRRNKIRNKDTSSTDTDTKEQISTDPVIEDNFTEKVPDKVQQILHDTITDTTSVESINQKLKTAKQLGDTLYKSSFGSIDEKLNTIRSLIKELPSGQRKEFNKHYNLFGYIPSKNQKNVIIPPTTVLDAIKYAYSKTFLDKSSWNVPASINKLDTIPVSVVSLYKSLKNTLTISSDKEFMEKLDKVSNKIKTSNLKNYLTAKTDDIKATKDRIKTVIEVFTDKKHEKNKPYKLIIDEVLNHVNHAVNAELRHLADYKYQPVDTKIHSYLSKETIGSQHDTINTKLLPLDPLTGTVTYKVLSKKTSPEELKKLSEQGLLRTVNLNPANYVKVGKVTELNNIDVTNVFPLKYPVLWSFYQDKYPLVHKGGIKNLAKPVYAYSYKEAAKRSIKKLTEEDKRLFAHLYDSPARGLLFNKSGEINDNVLIAMQIAATSHVSFNRNNLLPGFKPDSVIARMFDVEEIDVTPQMRSFAYTHGTPVRTMAHDTGRVIASLLGLKERTSETVNIGEYDHLLADLGHTALRVLGALRIGNTKQDSVPILKFDDVPVNEYAKAAGLPYKESNKATAPYASVVYIGDPAIGETAVHKNIVVYFDSLSEELKSFSHTTNEGKYPYFKSIPDSVINQHTSKVYKDLVGLSIPKKSQQAMRVMMKTPYTISKEELSTFVGYLNIPKYKKGILKHLGYIDIKSTQYSRLSYQDKISQKGKNAAIEESLASIVDLYNNFDEVAVDGIVKMYFPIEYLVNGRFYHNSTTIKPQGNKLHRFMFLPEGTTVNVTVDRLKKGIKVTSSEDKDITTNVYRGIAQAFGIDIEKTKTRDIKRIGTILTSLSLKEVQELRNSILLGKQPEVQKIKDSGFNLEVENIAHVLTALQFLEDANTKKEVITKLTYEEDVKTSGFSNKLQQFPVLTYDEKEQAILLARIGIFTPEYVTSINKKETIFDPANGKGVNDVFASKEQIGLLDSYEAQAEKVMYNLRYADFVGKNLTVSGRKWADSLIKLTPFSKAGDTSEDTTSLITSELRKVFKSPFMIFNYSAGLNRIIRNVSESTVTTIINNLAKKSEKDLTKEERQFINLLLSAEIRVTTPSKGDVKIRNVRHFIQALREYPIFAFKTKRPQYFININNKKEDPIIKVTYNQNTGGVLVKNLENLLLATIGVSIRHAFVTKFEKFIKIQDAMNDVFRLSFMVFEQKLEAQLKEKIKGKNVLTKKDFKDAIEDLSDILPYINGPLSEEGKRDGIAVIESKVRANLDEILHSRKAPQAHTYNEQGKVIKKTVQAVSPTLAMASNAGAVRGFHTLDGAEVAEVVNTLANKYKGEGVNIATIHDAFIAPIDSGGEVGKVLHKAMYNLNKEYNMFNEAARLLKRITSPEVLEDIDTSKIDIKNLKQSKDTVEDTIENLKDIVFSLNSEILEAKKLDYDTQGVFSQSYYATLGGGDTNGIIKGNGDEVRPVEDSLVSKTSEELIKDTDNENPVILGSSPATQFTKVLKGCD